MIELILHHYDTSPFSEKVRMMLGYKRLKWRSVTIPIVAPKPDLVALTGGYRRTPVLQIGADIYCDTALIARTLDRLHPAPTLYPGRPAAGRDRRRLDRLHDVLDHDAGGDAAGRRWRSSSPGCHPMR